MRYGTRCDKFLRIIFRPCTLFRDLHISTKFMYLINPVGDTSHCRCSGRQKKKKKGPVTYLPFTFWHFVITTEQHRLLCAERNVKKSGKRIIILRFTLLQEAYIFHQLNAYTQTHAAYAQYMYFITQSIQGLYVLYCNIHNMFQTVCLKYSRWTIRRSKLFQK